VRTLTRGELTAALAVRQMLHERQRLAPAEALRRLTPLQAQHPPAPYIALAARLEGFTRAELEAAIDAGEAIKATLMRLTLHLAAADEYPAYTQLARQARLRSWRKRYPHLDEAEVSAELGGWLGEPRTNNEIRERVREYEGVPDDPWTPLIFAETLAPFVRLPPAGHWADPRRPSLAAGPGPLPEPGEAAALVLARYLAAFGPASRRDVASWSGVAQRDFADAFDRLTTVTYRDEHGTELFDLPDRPLPPASTKLPVRFLAHWDQPLLAYAQRDRIIPPEVQPLKLTLSGDPTVTVDGLVAASWQLGREGDTARLTVTPHVEIARAAGTQIRAEAERTARFGEPDAAAVEVVGL
jgi:hypothetical protein